ncbi:MAG TPA: glycoside hydrolase family 15 protein [Conexibacter sp.]|jgi:GH15 family glucan-1,4-alpha-glucosidase
MAATRAMPEEASPAGYPPIADYALLSDCHAAALVSRNGAVDWCCMPRFDAGSLFGRLLDWERGGHCTIAPARLDAARTTRRYVGDTLVLETTLHDHDGGEIVLTDCLTMCAEDVRDPRRQLLRVAECREREVTLDVTVAARFDYGDVRPWLRRVTPRAWTATGGDDALVITADAALESDGDHDLRAEVELLPGERFRLSLACMPPELLEGARPRLPSAGQLDDCLERTLAWWREWAERVSFEGGDRASVLRSALTLAALGYAPTGAIIAAPTTSLPERLGGGRNWDYRFAWIRDASLASRSLADLGCEHEANRFRRFVERTAAGHAEDLKILYGVGGERRIGEQELALDGYAGSRPVRVGNAAAGQLQLDTLGELVNLSWRWHRRGHSPDDDHWRYLVSIVERAIAQWDQPDAGIWEQRGELRHFVHSKALCWAAAERALRLAEECGRDAPRARWGTARDAIRAAIETRGYDDRRGVFVQAFDAPELDPALLLLPTFGFVAWDDERMVRTAAAVREELGDDDGLLLWRRASAPDDSEAPCPVEGAFLACSFWLAECLAWQHQPREARRVFDRAAATANELGLFAEEYDPAADAMLGNFPQTLTHLAHVTAALALTQAPRTPPA